MEVVSFLNPKRLLERERFVRTETPAQPLSTVLLRSGRTGIDCAQLTTELPVGRDRRFSAPYVTELRSTTWHPRAGWKSFRFTVTKDSMPTLGIFSHSLMKTGRSLLSGELPVRLR